MAIVITDMTVCDGGNHVTLFVAEDGVPRQLPEIDISKLSPDRTFPQISEFMNEVRLRDERDVEPLYRAILVIRNAPAHTFEDMRSVVLSAYGAPA